LGLNLLGQNLHKKIFMGQNLNIFRPRKSPRYGRAPNLVLSSQDLNCLTRRRRHRPSPSQLEKNSSAEATAKP
jgi:hypothetical protein